MKLLIKNIVFPWIKSRPDFLIIGVQRAGTTSLYRYLIRHPQILVTHPLRETYYFDVEENYQKGFGWYLGHFPWKFQKQDKLTFEASPSYLYYKQIPQRIKQDLGDIKTIAILRNPAERAYSAWQMYRSYSSIPREHLRARADLRSFPEAIAQELNPESNTAKYPYNYLDRGKYFHQLENYYDCFPMDSILVLDFEQFRQDLGSALNRVSNFLNIQPFSSENIEQFHQEKYAAAKYKIADGDGEVIEQLKEYFVPFNEKLYEMLGHRYNW